MQKIGILFEYGTLNGGEHSMLAAIDSLQNRRCQFTVLAAKESALHHEVLKRNLTFECFMFRENNGQSIAEEAFVKQLNQFSLEHKLEVIHANSLTMGRHLGAVAKQLCLPTTCHVRDIMSLSRTAISDLNQHQKLFAVSEATRDFHIQQGIEPQRIACLYNGVDCERFLPRNPTGVLRKRLNLPDGTILAATIGQICLRKAQTDLVEAAVLLKAALPDLHYLLVGERHSSKQESIEFDQRITTTLTEAGIAHRLHRLGYVAEIPELLNEIDLLLHPAKQEPLGRVLLEAAASGVPIVTTNVGGTLEILTDWKSALIVKPGNPAALAEAIKKVVQSQELRQTLGEQARYVAVNKFNIQSNAGLLADAWEQYRSS